MSCKISGCNCDEGQSRISEVYLVELDPSMFTDKHDLEDSNVYRFLAPLDEKFQDKYEDIYGTIGRIAWQRKRDLVDAGIRGAMNAERNQIHYSTKTGKYVMILSER